MRLGNVVWVVALCACGGSDDAAGGASGAAGAAGASGNTSGDIQAFVDLVCENARTCCEQSGRGSAQLVDCESEQFVQNDLFRAVRDGTVVLLEPAYGQCLAALDAAACSGGIPRESCSRFFQGTVEAGGACQDSVECIRNADPVVCLRVDGASDDTPGVCRELVRAGEGQRCLISAQESLHGVTFSTFEPEANLALGYCDAADGLFCAFPIDICQPFVAEGGACQGEGCAEGLYCDDETDQTCKPEKPEGSACTSSQECAAPAFMCKAGVCTVPSIGDSDVCEGDLN